MLFKKKEEEKAPDFNIYYDFSKLFSYDKLFNFIVGERGVGKTYGMLKYVMNRYIKKGEQFVYVRRYKSEVKDISTIFAPLIANNEFGEHEIVTKGSKFYCDGKIAGYVIILSTAATKKSTAYPKVGTIIFDEYIIGNGKLYYMSREAEQFLELYETIARMRTVKVFFLGNAVSICNPYFDYFGLTIPYESEFKVYKNDMIVNYIKNVKYREAKKETRFGKMVEGTNYGNYAIDNQFLMDNNNFVEKKTGNCRIYCNLLLRGKVYGVWIKNDDSVVYFSNSYDPNCRQVYALEDADHDTFTKTGTGGHIMMHNLLKMYYLGKARFESREIKYTLLPVIQKLS